MSIQAKKEGLMRLIGMALIFVSIVISVIFDIFLFDCIPVTIVIIGTVAPWLIVFILIKLEKEFIIEIYKFIVIFLTIYTIGLLIIGSYACLAANVMINYVFIIISYVLIAVCWQYSLSIYKKEKLLYILSGIGYIVLIVIFKLFLWLIEVIPLLIFTTGFLMILLAEKSMRNKKMLNYI